MKTYEAYKESGVNWIGEIPEDWSLIRMKYSDETIMGQSPNSNDYILEEDPQAIPFLQGNAEFGKLSPKARLWCNEANKHSKINDILISVRAPIGAINLSDKIYGIGRGLSAVRGIRHYYKYLYYYLHSANEYLNVQGTGSTFTAISTSVLKELHIPNINIKEQTQIANYLDHKTQIIDALIEKKELLIKKLKEQRQAIINEAVTKGLNPNAPMKDSGIEWLGEIPEHWKFNKAKRNTYMKGRIGWQGLKQDEFIDEGPYLITGMNFKDGVIRWNEVYHITQERYDEAPEIQLKEGDVLMTKDGTIGKLLFVDNLPGPASLNSHLLVLRCTDGSYIPKYLYYQLMSELFLVHIELYKTGTTFYGITQESVGKYQILLPPAEEQAEIVKYLENNLNKLRLLDSKTKKQIKKLKAYRQSIISEAVTGKIDVRDWQTPLKNY